MIATTRTATRALYTTICLIFLLTSLMGCERKPEDLDKWKNAKGGMEKMIGWAKSKEESMAVRQKAIAILIEKGEAGKVEQMFSKMKDGEKKDALVSATVAPIEALWAKADFPKIDLEKAKEKGGRAKVEGGEFVTMAKDAAFYMYPFAKGDTKQKLQDILVSWLEKDHELRNQLGKSTLSQILPYTGERGFKGMMTWFEASKKSGEIARNIRKFADDKTKVEFAKVVAKKADKLHPNLDGEMRVVVLETNSPVIVPYLKKAIEDSASPPELADDAMDTLVRIQKKKATPYIAKLIGKKKGLFRWVAVTRMIELRGKPGVYQAVNGLPLEIEKYEESDPENTLKPSSSYFCNVVKSELGKQGIKDEKEFQAIFGKLIDTNRWPAKVLGIRCAEQYKHKELKPKIEALIKDKQAIPGWGDKKTLGDVAKDALKAL